MSQNLIVQTPSDILASATSRVGLIIRTTKMGASIAHNVRREARSLGFSFEALRTASGLSTFRLARLWFTGEGAAVDLMFLQKALGADAAAIWSVR